MKTKSLASQLLGVKPCCILVTTQPYLVHQLLVISRSWGSLCLVLGGLPGSVAAVGLDLRVIGGVVRGDRLHRLHPLHPAGALLLHKRTEDPSGRGCIFKKKKQPLSTQPSAFSSSPPSARCSSVSSSFGVNHSLQPTSLAFNRHVVIVHPHHATCKSLEERGEDGRSRRRVER